MTSPQDFNIGEQFQYLERAELNSNKDVKTYIRALNKVSELFKNHIVSNIDENLYELTLMLQNVRSKEIYKTLNEQAIPILIEIYKEYLRNSEIVKKDQFSSTDLMMLKIFAIYPNEISRKSLIEAITDNYRASEYLWSVIFNVLAEQEIDFNKFIDDLNGVIPQDFLGISYLDFCNSLLLSDKLTTHPFNSTIGKERLMQLVQMDGDDYSYAVSATTAVPFFERDFATELLSKASRSTHIEVKLEASWAGAKLGLEEYRENLIEFCKDYRYSTRSSDYLKELNLEGLIPEITKSDDFQALSEMCNWLSHPNEFGSYPDKAEIFDSRVLYWPPTRDQRKLYLIKYTYNHYNEDGSDENGIGLVGSVTFSLFGLDNILEKSAIEIYSIHCNWELEEDDYENIEKGLKLLKSKNNL